MYIKLNSIRIQYLQNTNDYIILSEVTDSGLSYEKPVIIRNRDELDIWFGKNFTDYDYFSELLERNISLYLYKPVSEEKIKDDQYIDLSEYTPANETYPTPESLPSSGDPSTKYWVGGLRVDWDSLMDGGEIETYPENPDPETKYFVVPENYWVVNIGGQWITSKDSIGCWYIWIFDSWISEKDLPQNTEETTISQENRDTLLIPKPEYTGNIIECNPEYHEQRLGVFSKNYSNIPTINPEEPIKLENLDSTYCASISYDNAEQDTLPYYYYLVIPDPITKNKYYLAYNDVNWDDLEDGGIVDELVPGLDTNKKYLYNNEYYNFNGSTWRKETERVDNKVSKRFIPEERDDSGNNRREKITGWGDLLGFIEGLGYYIEDDKIYSQIPIPIDYYFDFPGFNMAADYRETQNLLCSQLPENDWGFEVWSKTIGKSDQDYNTDNIKFSVFTVTPGEVYQITISRFNYSEIFEGKLHPEPGEERLDYKVSKESKLVHLRFNNINSGLREGDWILQGAKTENYNPEMYWKGLSMMFNEDNISPDYFLVPDKKLYTNKLSDLEYQQKFLDYAKGWDFQVLIQNNPSPFIINEVEEKPEWNKDLENWILWKYNDEYYKKGEDSLIQETDIETIEIAENKGDFIYNYLGDPDNRLVYFFQDMTVYRRPRPAYYIYLTGLFFDIYSVSVQYINYLDFLINPYTENGEEIEKTLKHYKSNYLTTNNQIYYYKDYCNGEVYNSTAWMRFAISKITRELKKQRWNYLAKRSEVEIRKILETILNNLQQSFSIIDYINITDFSISYTQNKLAMRIETGVKDLINNNIGLDITINYSE